MVLTAEQFRQRRALQQYGRNTAAEIVRASAFRECDYTEAGQLHEFDTEAEVLAFEAERYNDGSGYRVKFRSKPEATVAREQLAENGNQTRVQLAGVEGSMHTRMDEMEKKLDKVLGCHEKAPPPSQEGDLELMARVQKMCKLGRMSAIVAAQSA